MWMSLARSFAARKSSELTSRMIGASSSVSRRSCGSSSSWARLWEVLGLHLPHQLLGLVQCPVVDPLMASITAAVATRGETLRWSSIRAWSSTVVSGVSHRQGHRLAVHRQGEDQRLLGS
jgi:hypothetical protein